MTQRRRSLEKYIMRKLSIIIGHIGVKKKRWIVMVSVQKMGGYSTTDTVKKKEEGAEKVKRRTDKKEELMEKLIENQRKSSELQAKQLIEREMEKEERKKGKELDRKEKK